MLQRFASAALVATIAIAVAALVILLAPGITLRDASPVLLVWCLAPCVWGLWAMVAPQDWVPQRLPMWGSVLGLIGGVFALFVLNLPQRILALSFPAPARVLGVFIIAAVYYAVWMIVAVTYRHLSTSAPVSTAPKSTRTAA